MSKHGTVAAVLAQSAAELGKKSSHSIWRSVVFAGAMLGSTSLAACGGKAKTSGTTPEPSAVEVAPKTEGNSGDVGQKPVENTVEAKPENPCGAAMANPCAPVANPCAPATNPCAATKPETKTETGTSTKRPRNTGTRPVGRGFVLA